MGNLSCVPQPHRQIRYSFSRKNSMQGKEQDSRTKWTYLFGNESGVGRATHSDNILHYIPGKDIGNDVQKDNVDQRFLSIFRKGKKKTIVRNMGQMIHYSKVKFRFQHSPDISDCYLELFQSQLYFQSRGPTGLTYQGLVPLKELSVYKLERSKVPPKPEEEHAFRITGPLLNPLIVYCPTQQELQKWLYHLEKQIQLNGGSLDPLPITEMNNVIWDKSELRRSVQSQPVQDWEGTQRESLGTITCISKVKLQTLPFQELNDRVLVLYPATLVILSEEGKNLSFKGELPLKAVRVITDDNEKLRSSFLLEGRYINTIRVICLNQQDYDEWIDHLRNAQLQNRDSSLSASSSFCGSHSTPHEQVTASCRSSFTSDGRTKSWASGGKLANSNQHSNSNTQGSDRQSYTVLGEQNVPENPLSPGYSQPVHCLTNPNWSSGVNGQSNLQRGGSIRGSKGKKNLCLQMPSSMPHSYDIENTGFGLIPETPSEDVLSPLYKEPYSYQKPHATVTPQEMLNRLSLADRQQSTSQSNNQALSSLYAEPYTPTRQTSGNNNFVEELLRSLNTNRTETHASHVKNNGSFHVTQNAHPPLQKIFSHPVKGSQQLVKPILHRNSEPDTSVHSRLVSAAQTPFFKSAMISSLNFLDHSPAIFLTSSQTSQSTKPQPVQISSVKAEMQRNKEVEEMFDLPSSSSLQTDTLDHDYAELQSFQSDFSYDNIWDYEIKEKDLNRFSSPSYPGHFVPGIQSKTVASRWL